MGNAIRVLHVPGRTPYSRKLRGPGVAIVNETTSAGVSVPRDASFDWINRQTSLGFFDVLHVQSVELAKISAIQKTLDRCVADRKSIVVTVHDVEPLFPEDGEDFVSRVRLVCHFASAVIALTKRSGEEIAKRFGVVGEKVQVVPHGPVLSLRHALWKKKRKRNRLFTVGMFGGVRPNRSFLAAAVNALYGLESQDVRVRILSRGLNPIELGPASEALELVALAGRDARLSLELLPFPSDDEIARFVHSLDLLVLPYLCGTHSGQLELAFDLGVPVVAPAFGCYRDQWRLHQDSLSEPFWLESNPADPYSYGAPMLATLRAAHTGWRKKKITTRKARFAADRRREQEAILRAHADIYARAIS